MIIHGKIYLNYDSNNYAQLKLLGGLSKTFGDQIVTISSYDEECKTGGGGVVIPKVNIVEIQHLEGGRIDPKGIRPQPLSD